MMVYETVFYRSPGMPPIRVELPVVVDAAGVRERLAKVDGLDEIGRPDAVKDLVAAFENVPADSRVVSFEKSAAGYGFTAAEVARAKEAN